MQDRSGAGSFKTLDEPRENQSSHWEKPRCTNAGTNLERISSLHQNGDTRLTALDGLLVAIH